MKPITISFFSIVLLVGSASLLSKNEAKDLENPYRRKMEHLNTESNKFQQNANSKMEIRRLKAFESYEESCKTDDKFKIRSCPKLVDCYRNNNLKLFPSARFERHLLVRDVASEFLQMFEDKNIKKENSSNEILKRFLFGSTLTEETNERRERAFEDYEELCEKSIFGFGIRRITSHRRNCPQLDDKLC